jgi:hypothetical protein
LKHIKERVRVLISIRESTRGIDKATIKKVSKGITI